MESDPVGRTLLLDAVTLPDELGQGFGVRVRNFGVADHELPPNGHQAASCRAQALSRAVGPLLSWFMTSNRRRLRQSLGGPDLAREGGDVLPVAGNRRARPAL